MIDRETIHVDDVLARIDTEYPNVRLIQGGHLARTVLAAPLLREEVPIGAILIRRMRGSTVHGQADRPSENLRRSGRDRHRERAAVSRIG